MSCSHTGWWDFSTCTSNNGVRPALIMPSDAIVNGDGTIDVSNVYFDISAEPSQSGTMTYTGEEQTVTWDNYDSTQLTISGTTSASDAGTYTATFTPKKHYRWGDGTTDAKEITWTIKKAAGSMEVSPPSLAFDMSDEIDSQIISVTRSGNGAVSATSSDTSVATVSVSDTTVTVTKQAVGSTDITISTAAGTNYTAPSNITVPVTVKASLKGISLNESNITLETGETETLKVIYNPSDTTDSKTVTWTSSNPDVATVSDGTITAVAKGTTTITAKVGSYTADCTVSVSTAVGTTYEIRSDGYTYVLDKNGNQTDKFLTNDAFVVPESGSYSLEIHGGGGGGAGGYYYRDTYYYYYVPGGGGGGAGEIYETTLQKGDSYSIVIGSGGSGGASLGYLGYNPSFDEGSTKGGNGGASSFGNLYSVPGGGGGGAPGGGYPAQGGSASGSVATTGRASVGIQVSVDFTGTLSKENWAGGYGNKNNTIQTYGNGGSGSYDGTAGSGRPGAIIITFLGREN